MQLIKRGDLVLVGQSVCLVLSVRRDVLGGSCASSYIHRGQRFMFVQHHPLRSEVLVSCTADGFQTWIDESLCDLIALG